MTSKPKNIFFLGKGGVGKSTISALTSLKLSEQNNILLVSMDPAHNLSDIFAQQFSDKPQKVNKKLRVVEINIENYIKEYLNDIEIQVSKNYSYLTSFNLDNYFKMIKYSPGIEEFALITAFKNITKKYVDMDYIIFDMPPTALAVKFFGLPQLSLQWLEQLFFLRDQILKKKEIITKVKVLKKENETDKILRNLNSQISFYKNLNDEFSNNDKTNINLVMNTDKLSFSETELIYSKLKDFKLSIDYLIINKVTNNFSQSTVSKVFKYNNIKSVGLSSDELIGTDNLEKFILENKF